MHLSTLKNMQKGKDKSVSKNMIAFESAAAP